MKEIVGFPDRVAMVNRATHGAYILNFQSMDPQPQTVKVETGADLNGQTCSLEAFAINANIKICEALLLQSVSFQILSGAPLTLEDLKETRFSLMIDGEMIIPDKAFTDHLEVGCRPIPDPGLDFSNPLLPLLANQLDGEDALADSTFGYFIPNNTVIVVLVRKLPAGRGKIEIETKLVAAMYSTTSCSTRRG